MPTERFDVVVVGGGPAGCATAAEALAHDPSLHIAVLESGPRPHSQCSGALSRDMMDRMSVRPSVCPPVSRLGRHENWELPSQAIQSTIEHVRIKTPGGTIALESPGEAFGPIGTVMDRKKFDDWLVELARSRGAQVLVRHKVVSVVPENGGVRVRCQNGAEFEAPIVVGADGPESIVAKQAGFPLALREDDVFLAVEVYVDAPFFGGGTLELAFDPALTPYGYAWAFSAGSSVVKVGLGIPRILKDAPYYLRQYRESDGFDGQVLRRVGGVLTTPPPQESLVRGRVALVGEAGRLMDALLAAGDSTAVTSGRMLGAVLGRHQPLSSYQREYREFLYPFCARRYKLKRVVWDWGPDFWETAVHGMSGFRLTGVYQRKQLGRALFRAGTRHPLALVRLGREFRRAARVIRTYPADSHPLPPPLLKALSALQGTKPARPNDAFS